MLQNGLQPESTKNHNVNCLFNILNIVIPYGWWGAREMMHRLRRYNVMLRKYDVAHFIHNDAMFANSLGEAGIISVSVIINEVTSFAVRQTSLK